MEYLKHGDVTKQEWLRFMEKVSLGEKCLCTPEKPHTHWLWQGCTGHNGYGQFKWRGAARRAHRFAYIALRGDILSGYELDHLCRIRNCVNPQCVEVVTHQTNQLRGKGIIADNAGKTHCPRGHRYSGEKITKSHGRKKTERICRECRAIHNRTYTSKH